MSETPLVPFEAVISDVTASFPRIAKGSYQQEGRFPVIDQGAEEVAGYTDDESLVSSLPGSVLLFGDHTRRFKLPARPFVVGADGVKVLQPAPTLDPVYAFHWFQFLELPSNGYSRHFKFLKETLIPLPPLPEQRRIVSLLDQAEARVAVARRAQSSLTDIELSVFESFAKSATESVRLGDIATFVRGVTFKPESVVDPLDEGALRFMRTTNVKHQLDLSDVKAIAPSVKVRDDQMLRDGDILVSTANSWNLVGRASFIPELPWPSTFGGFVSVLRSNDARLSPRFVHSWFTSPRVQSALRSFGQQTTNISNLNIARTLELRLPVLGVDDRKRFDAVVASIDDLRVKLERSESLSADLVSALRARAFRAEL